MTHQIQNWCQHAAVKALQTNKHLTHAISGFNIHPNQQQTTQLKQLQQLFNLPHQVYFLKQTHGAESIELTQPLSDNFQYQADACYSREKGVICAIMTADCLPVLLTNNTASFVAAVHCGWRSLYQNILIKTLQKINSKQKVKAWFGPSICQNHYEVDSDFVTHYLAKHPYAFSAFSTIKKGKSQCDLRRLASLQLQQLGVHDITMSDHCTFADNDYYSWRENKTAARQASLIWKC